MSATAALAWMKVCRQSVKMIAAQNRRAEIEPRSPGKNGDRGQRRGESGRQARSERVLPEDAVARDLEPISERRLIEAVTVVEIRNDIIAALDHFARRLGEARLIAIDQRQRPGAGEMKKQAPKKEEREIAGCRLQESDSKMARPKDNRQILDAQNRAGLEVALHPYTRDRRDRGIVSFRCGRADTGCSSIRIAPPNR